MIQQFQTSAPPLPGSTRVPVTEKLVLNTFPVASGLLEPRHVKAIDPRSAWPVYLWFINRVTEDRPDGTGDYVGLVLRHEPVLIEHIAAELGIGYRGCRKHIAHLVKKGYVIREKTGTGASAYLVTKSKKWIWRRKNQATDTNYVSGSCTNSDPQTRIESLDQAPLGTSLTSHGHKSRPCRKEETTEKTVNRKPQTSWVPSSKPREIPYLFSSIEKAENSKPTRQPKSNVRGTRIPEHFGVTEQHREFARQLGVNADLEFEKFRDYWLGVSGQKAVKCDWDATFRNWLRKAADLNDRSTRKAPSRHTNLSEIDYQSGLGSHNADGTFKF